MFGTGSSTGRRARREGHGRAWRRGALAGAFSLMMLLAAPAAEAGVVAGHSDITHTTATTNGVTDPFND